MDLLIGFTDESSSFTNGVEFGRLLQKMQEAQDFVTNDGFPIHIQNIDVFKSACISYGYVYSFNNCFADGWINFLAIKKTTNNN